MVRKEKFDSLSLLVSSLEVRVRRRGLLCFLTSIVEGISLGRADYEVDDRVSFHSVCADYDVYPYATFTVPTQLQTFRDCSEGNPMGGDNMQSLQRKRRNSSKNLHDTMSLGKCTKFLVVFRPTPPLHVYFIKTVFCLFTRNRRDSLHIEPANLTNRQEIRLRYADDVLQRSGYEHEFQA